jgi:hypothetical protein
MADARLSPPDAIRDPPNDGHDVVGWIVMPRTVAPKGQSPKVSLRLNARVLAAVDDEAERLGVGRSEVLRRLVGLGIAWEQAL